MRRSLADLAAEAGKPLPCTGNLPLDMSDLRYIWFVESGSVDVFFIEQQDDIVQSAPQHLMRTGSGRILPSVEPHQGETRLGLIAKGLPGTQLRRLPVGCLDDVSPEEQASLVDIWVLDFSTALSRDVRVRPRPDAFLEAGQPQQLTSGIYTTRQGTTWVHAPAAAASAGLFMGVKEISTRHSDGASDLIPLTPASWLTLSQPAELTPLSSATLAQKGQLFPALTGFHQAAFFVERINRSLAVADQANLERARALNRRNDEDGARHRLFNMYDQFVPEQDGGDGSALREALRIIGRHEQIDFIWPAHNLSGEVGLGDVLDVSGVRKRRVRLAGGQKWWVGDSGALLAFRSDNGQPVALLPGVMGHYRMVDPIAGTASGLSASQAKALRSDAWFFYRPLKPAGIGARQLLEFAGRGLGTGIARFAGAGVLSGLITLLPAVIAGFIVNRVIPIGEIGLLYFAILLLIVFAIVMFLAQLVQGLALMRIEGQVASRIEAAFWDRMLRLSPGFLNRYPSGDRAMRGMTFMRIRDAIQGVVASDTLSIVFLFPALLIILFYDTTIGIVCLLFGFAALALTILLGMRQIPPQARAITTLHRLTGRLFQIISGIAKLHVDGAEGSAFAVWARDYRERQRAALEYGFWEGHLSAFGTALPLVAGSLLLLMMTLHEAGDIAVGDFLVIYVAFMVFVTGVVRFGESFGAVAAIVPEFAHVQPFLAKTPETETGGEPVEHLGGDILFDRVSFCYNPDGPLILRDVTIRAHPGEFVAIAGESGGGKSTLFRLMLGLNQPTAGAIFYDGRDLRQLNNKQLRRKIGSVPQEIQLHPQDLWDNIVGDQDDAGADQVWRAAKAAAVDEQIKSMPMGMLTCVGNSGSVTSGGESQRIQIARALMRSPRILLLDEATSWLDNESQSEIMKNLAEMTATRIVIAHRLSTLRQADRIYVLQSGRIAQEGTYAELMQTDGPFRKLASHQIS
ncbi:MAG: ATP-binding cassette domain-containing protein [Rhodobacteraceae bacterium]|nr:ATP-binding cassette domain-containing protein [Paracoccaceae bacterium]